MNSPLIAAPLSGNVIGSAGNNFVIAEWRDPGGPVGEHRLIAPFHVHRSDDEAWHVLEGTICVRSAEDEIRAEAGSAVEFVQQVLGYCGDFRKVEFFVVLDRVSKDNTLDLLKDYAATDRRLAPVWSPENRCVVDASVAIKWFVPEIHSDAALRLRGEAYELIAPDLLILEIGNILWKRSFATG